ncbi:MAG: TonB-dependent receptor [Pseudomonadota bacterium]
MRVSRKLYASASILSIALYSAAAQAGSGAANIGDEIIVSASPIARPVDQTIGGASVVSSDELRRRLENSIAETIRREPGVSSTFFGPSASRPIIRGLSGDRVRVLDNGIGSIDASVTSQDHAVTIDPAAAEQVDIVRGTAMLRYGSSAAGGVVNVISNKIPTRVPEGDIDVFANVGNSTNDDGFRFGGSVDAALGEVGNGTIVLHGDGFYRDGDDYLIPGFAESAALRAAEEAEGPEEDEEEEVFGEVENTFYETRGATGGLSWVFEDGFIGISGTAIDSLYGVPGAHEHEEGEEEEEEEEEGEEEGGVTLDVRQRRIDLAGEINRDFGPFNKASLRIGFADYEHIEFEPNGEAGTVFSNEGLEGRLELLTRPKDYAGWEANGAVGLQFRQREFSAIGEEAFVPLTDSSQFGVFGVKEATKGNWRLEIGGRYEHTSHDGQATGEILDIDVDRTFNSFSVSGGVAYTPTEEIFLGVTGSRTERAPSIEELFSNGPHLATNAFEIGDITLDEEVARGVEATARYTSGGFAIGVNGFYTSYKDFIYETATGEEEDGLPVFQFFANDAEFIGFEVETGAELFNWAGLDFSADASASYVRATVDAADEDLPRIPPLRGLIGIEANSEFLDVRGEVELVDEQNDVAAFELPTEGFTLFNLYASYRPTGTDSIISLNVAATNLFDEEARQHASFVKDLAPLLGRNITFSVSANF